MVCKMVSEDEAMASSTSTDDVPQACIVVKDVTKTIGGSSGMLWLFGTVTVSQLFDTVTKATKSQQGTFELLFEHPVTGKTTVLSEHMESTLQEAGFVCDGGSMKNKLVVTNRGSEPVTKVEEEIPAEIDEVEEDSGGTTTYASFTIDLKPDPSRKFQALTIKNVTEDEPKAAALVHIESQIAVIPAKPEIKFIGLVNQAMTCYLNSLVQTLYMTPEFRNALYRWHFDASEEEQEKSIPFQLQKLFLQLQTSDKSAVGTTNLTRSFGWDSSEAWQQHDIQELCRVMFDALEHKFKNTDQADLISRLYEGKMIDYVRCLECSTEKAREDTFLDIPLPVRPFGSQTSFGSVEEALKAFVMPETLDGNNQYWCDKCNKKCDAHKGLKFSRFPYLLTLHLKRFDFDYNTLHRIKLNDKVTFPDVLELDSFIAGLEGDKQKEAHDGVNDDSLSEVSEPSAANSSTGTESQEDDEGIDVGTTLSVASGSSKGVSDAKSRAQRGECVYELFSIMIHSGSASGGHYYAYIKDFASHQWYCFNDQNVSTITYDDIRRTYGGGPSRGSGYYSSAYTSSANAYMLMYRQVDKERNADFILPDAFPAHISALLKRLKGEEESAKDAEEKERNTCKIQLYCRHPKRGKFDLSLKLHKDTTLRQATSVAYEKIGDLKQLGIPLERCRLVKYNDFYDTVDCSWDDQMDEPIHQVLGGVRTTYKFDLLLEIVAEGEKFQVYTPGCASVRVMRVKVEEEELDVVDSVRVSVSSNVVDLKNKVKELFGLAPDMDPSRVHIVLIKFTNDLRLLDDDDASLQSVGFRRNDKIYVTTTDQSEWSPTFKQRFYDLIERFEHSVTISVTLPDVSKETLDRLGIDVNSSRPLIRPASPSDSLSPDGGFEDSLSRLEKERALSESEDEEDKGRAGYKELDNEDSSSSEPEENAGVSLTDCNVPSTSTSASASEDSSLSLTDSDRTLLGDPPEEIPEAEDTTGEMKTSPRRNAIVEEDPSKYFFVVLSTQELSDNGKVCNILADKRIPLSEFKCQLESLLSVPADFLLVYKKTVTSGFASSGEREWSNPSETLETLGDDPEVVVRLGRALRPGEVRGKVYLLDPNDSAEKSRLLFDWILSPEITVGQVKRQLIAEAKASCGLDISHDKCVLRRKNWRTPSNVYADEEDNFGSELMYVFKNWEMYLQVLDPNDADDVCQAFKEAEISLFSRQWNPDTLTLGPFVNAPLKECGRKEFAAFLLKRHGIPAEFVEITKATGSFPCDISVLGIHDSLSWYPLVDDDNSDAKWPSKIQSDGDVVLWRDKRTPLKKLTDQERKEILGSENRESPASSTYPTYTSSARRERGLKIYLDTPTEVKDDIDVD